LPLEDCEEIGTDTDGLSELTERQKKFSGFRGETSDKIVGLTGRCDFVLRNGKSGM
jgi:hypothetical protein